MINSNRFPVALLCCLLLLLAFLPPQPRPQPSAPVVEVNEMTHRVYLPLVASSPPPLMKKGLGVCDGCTCEQLDDLGVTRVRSWNWDSVMECPGIESMACVRDAGQAAQAIAAGYIAGGKDVATFNETDRADQANQDQFSRQHRCISLLPQTGST